MVLGLAIAAGLIVAMQVPLLHRASDFTMTMRPVDAATRVATPLVWPSTGSAALYIPSIGVTKSWNDHVVPIASLTKMMTAYVTLQALPLAPGQIGPCVTVTPADVTTFAQMNSTDQSSALVAVGEQLCESVLLSGMLVHSAGNYAMILSSMVSPSSSAFVDRMNSTAASLGLTSTHYADESGYSAASVSTALDQAHLAAILMRSPIVRAIVAQPSVTLPVAGTLNSFTPLVGLDNVIGVKSGRTDAAGGCDVMAMTFQQDGQQRLIYSVILGQRSGDMLTPAGAAALALANSALANRLPVVFERGTVVGNLGWGTFTTPVVLAHRHEVYWWASQGRLATYAFVRSFTAPVRAGAPVGWLVVHGLDTHRYELVAGRSVAPPTIWQRLR